MELHENYHWYLPDIIGDADFVATHVDEGNQDIARVRLLAMAAKACDSGHVAVAIAAARAAHAIASGGLYGSLGAELMSLADAIAALGR